MTRFGFWRPLIALMLLVVLAACSSATPTPRPTNTPVPSLTPQPTITPFNFNPNPTSIVVTANVVVTSVFPPTAAIPPTNPPTGPYVLNGGAGITNGAPMNNGEFQVEGYCNERGFDITQDGNFWYCVDGNGNRTLTLGSQELDEICFRTYGVAGAYAQLTGGTQPAVFRYRCYAVN